jgi:hypothetical protein
MSLATDTDLVDQDAQYDERIAEEVLYALWGLRRDVSSRRTSPVSQHVATVGWLYAVPLG